MEERQDLIDVLIADHREIERMFTELAGMTGRTDIFPLVRESCPRERLLELGAEAVRARHAVPDQPHPTTPGTPGSSGTPWAGLVDRVRRALTGHS
ncbi:hypothetical protein ACIBIZ_35640 [Nonomuraea spiralis]|uniref:hypothetical protein n=1 Tax=Nonomuraea TaxID=83681 RepID=UPI000F76C3AF|nr:hypothetical protein [Nonomuraea sp. WAC 01424]RSN04837.1 hypothetical protein DMB42_28995 [Nonomuraea sp. WAC 01424]